MAGRGFPWFQLLALLVVFMSRSMDTFSRPAEDSDTLALLAEFLEQWHVGPGTSPLGYETLLSWSFTALNLLVTGVLFNWWLKNRLWRRRREEKQQSASASAGTGCQGHDCYKELLQLLRENRALMRLCMRHCPLKRPRERRRRKWGICNRKRRYLPPSCCLSSPALHL